MNMRSAILLSAVFLFLAINKISYSQEVVLLDETIEWKLTTSDNIYGGNGFYWFHRNEGVVNINWGGMPSDDWTTPNNFFDGDFYMTFEVLEQPTNNPFIIAFAIWQDLDEFPEHSEIISNTVEMSGGAGSSFSGYIGTPSQNWVNWMHGRDDPVDFTRPEDYVKMGLVLWNPSPFCIPNGWDPNACYELGPNFFTMKARVRITAIPEGTLEKNTVTFVVKDEDSNPLDEAEISINGVNIITNPSGEATIDLDDGTYSYTVSKNGFGESSQSLIVEGSDITENVTMIAERSGINFFVKDEEGSPISGANISIWGNNLTTNSEGKAILALYNGTYSYTVTKSGYNQFTGSITIDGMQVTENITLTVPKYSIIFNIIDEGGLAVNAASVSVNGNTQSTNASGETTFELPNGDFTYTVSKSGFSQATGTVSVSGSGKTENIILFLESHTVTFNVKDESDQAVEGAQISINGASLTTNSSGQASISLPDGNYDYSVNKSGFAQTTGSVSVSGSDMTKNIILSSSNFNVNFLVKDNESNPIEGATISVDGNTLTTDASGEAGFTASNGSYSYEVTKTDYNSQSGSVTVSGADVTENVTLTLSTYTITFQVNDESSSPVSGASITLNSNTEVTDGSGEAVFVLPNDTYSYTVSKDGFSQASGNITVSGSNLTENVTLVVPVYTVTFSISDESSSAIQGASVDINGQTLTSDLSGEATISLSNGDFNYTVSKDGFEQVNGSITVAGTDITESISLIATKYTLTFVITTEAATAIEGVAVTINSETLITNASGKATIELPNGTYTYTAAVTGYEPKSGNVTISGGDKLEAASLTAVENTVYFVVKDEASAALENATININGSTLTTDGSGTATITLPYGSHSYSASKSGYETVNSTVNVSGSDITENIILPKVIGIESKFLENVQIYPNPARDIFVISAEKFFSSGTEFTVYSLNGTVIHSLILENPDQKTEINLSGFDKGMYLLEIRNNQSVTTRKLVLK